MLNGSRSEKGEICAWKISEKFLGENFHEQIFSCSEKREKRKIAMNKKCFDWSPFLPAHEGATNLKSENLMKIFSLQWKSELKAEEVKIVCEMSEKKFRAVLEN